MVIWTVPLSLSLILTPPALDLTRLSSATRNSARVLRVSVLCYNSHYARREILPRRVCEYLPTFLAIPTFLATVHKLPLPSSPSILLPSSPFCPRPSILPPPSLAFQPLHLTSSFQHPLPSFPLRPSHPRPSRHTRPSPAQAAAKGTKAQFTCPYPSPFLRSPSAVSPLSLPSLSLRLRSLHYAVKRGTQSRTDNSPPLQRSSHFLLFRLIR